MSGGSRQLKLIETRDFWITCAAWDGGYGESFEIGIRKKIGERFWLIQSEWNERTVLRAGEVIKLALDAGFLPEEIQSLFP